MSNKSLGQLIRKLRKEKGFSLRKLAEKVDVSYVNIAHIENGRSGASRKVIKKLAEALDYDADKLLAAADEIGETTKSILKQLSKALDYDLDKLLAVGNNVGEDIEKIITKKPDVVPEFLRTAKNLTKEEWKQLTDQVKEMKRKK